jgi:glycerol-3-phosphate dehydrogenase subunit C
MKEGSLGAPVRHPIKWESDDYYDEEKLDAEMRRVFDVCHGCRRCFNLCDSFPRLFDLIDAAPSGELDTVDSKDFKPVVDACTLCDMCFMVKCPYVPPHEFNIDFPHLMLQYRAIENKKGNIPLAQRELVKMDRNGKISSPVAPLVNWATKTDNPVTRPVMEKTIGIHRKASIPKFHTKTLMRQALQNSLSINKNAPAYGQKAIIYATCFGNYNNPSIGLATQKVLAHNGIEAQVVYPGCCGMPSLEQGNLPKVAEAAARTSKELRQWVDQGYTIIALVPSCALMLKQEWPLILPDNDDVQALRQATMDVSQYIVKIAKDYGLAEGLKPLSEGVTLHIACHARAQNMGQKAAEMLRLIPQADVTVIERCSGHGGSWGMMKDNFEVALKIGKPVARQTAQKENRLVLSECPLAGEHILQGISFLPENNHKITFENKHPIEIMAHSYGLGE